jgi:hypothetical protein
MLEMLSVAIHTFPALQYKILIHAALGSAFGLNGYFATTAGT